MSTPARQTVFPKRSSAETKADITSRAAKEIIEKEAKARRAKTAQLRQARQKREASEFRDAPSENAPSHPASNAKQKRSGSKAAR